MQRNMYQRRNQRLERSFQFTGLDLTEFRTLFSLVVGLDIFHPSSFPIHPLFSSILLSFPFHPHFTSILLSFPIHPHFTSILLFFPIYHYFTTILLSFPIHPHFTSILLSFPIHPHFTSILLSFPIYHYFTTILIYSNSIFFPVHSLFLQFLFQSVLTSHSLSYPSLLHILSNPSSLLIHPPLLQLINCSPFSYPIILIIIFSFHPSCAFQKFSFHSSIPFFKRTFKI